VVIMKTTSVSPRSGQRTASSSTVVFLHGHQLDRNLAWAAVAEAAGTFVLVLAITSTAVAAALYRRASGGRKSRGHADGRQCARGSRRGMITQRDKGRPTSVIRSPIWRGSESALPAWLSC